MWTDLAEMSCGTKVVQRMKRLGEVHHDARQCLAPPCDSDRSMQDTRPEHRFAMVGQLSAELSVQTLYFGVRAAMLQ